MIRIQPAKKARLFIQMQNALGVSDDPRTKEEAQLLALIHLVTGFTGDDGNFAVHEVFQLAEALDFWLAENTSGEDWGFSISNVARLVGNKEIARNALRLLGARPTTGVDDIDDYSTAPGHPVESVRFPPDVLVDQIKLELEEAQSFAA